MGRTGGHHRLRLLAAVTVSLGLVVAGCGSGQRLPAAAAITAAQDTLAHARFNTKPGPAGSVLTQRGDDTRLGWDSTETQLTVATVGSPNFGKRAAFPVDGKVYAQPLFVPNLRIDGRPHDVVIVATQHDTVYAFDAQATGSGTGPLWQTSLLQPGARTFLAATDRVGTNRLCDSITPEVGISSTPVIDWADQRIYVMALDVEHGRLTYRMHELSLSTGTDTRPSTVVSATVPGSGIDAANGQVTFTAGLEQQRMGLTLVNGVVYAGFSSWCGLSPYHGWVLGYSTGNLARTIVYNTTPNSDEGGLWESASGITVDSHGHLFLVTGNGPYTLNSGGSDVGDSLLEMIPQAGTLKIVDEFTPFDQECRYEHDQDLGSGSPLLLPGGREMVLSSKTGAVYVLDTAHLGGYTALPNACKQRTRTDVDKITQELAVDSVPGGMWGTWGYWASAEGQYVYGSGSDGKPTQWKLAADGTIEQTPVATAPESFSFPGAIPVVSSNGSTAGSGIVWTVDQTSGAVLRAFDASNIGDEIYNSARDASRDGLDDTNGFNHFDVPTIADGLVFVGDQSHLEIFGLLNR
ncbi:MAG TPA: hypothetical protein VHX38_04220 [Pseudonocardiaceae bacterium]|jgi:hypothetical protein|nr:hypothetical protein [Pseudonocardiaceae bacterium]